MKWLYNLCKRYVKYCDKKKEDICNECGGDITVIGHGVIGCEKCGKVTMKWKNGAFVEVEEI